MGVKVTIPNTGNDYLTFGSANTADAAKVGGYEDSTGNGHLELYTTASGTPTERMRIDSAGNVGIGTSSPSDKLHVIGNTKLGSAGYISFLNSANDYSAWINNSASGGDGNLTFYVGGTATAKMLSSHNFQFNSGYGSVATAYGVRAWVKFQGTGTVTINYSGNVSSITDAGTGIYYINFASGMTDMNYCPQLSTWDDGVSATATINKRIQVGTASQAQVFISDAVGTGKDANPVFVSVVR